MAKSKTTVSRRLDISPSLVRRAKIAYAKRTGHQLAGDLDAALEAVEFRAVVDLACTKWLGKVEKLALQAGLAPKGDVQQRPRPVTIETWDELGGVSERCDLDRVQLVRAVLELLAREGDI